MILFLLACSGPDWADVVLDAPGADPEAPYGDPALATNGARGGGCCAGGTDVYSLRLDGSRDHLVVAFSDRVVVDGPGDDLVVFENPFDIAGGGTFMDPIVVGVSPDGERFVDFPVQFGRPTYSDDPLDWEGFAGLTPVEHDVDDPDAPSPDDEASGGDRFDLFDLPEGEVRDEVLDMGVLAVRLRPAGLVTDPTTGAPFPTDPVSDGPDIDAVYAWHFAPR